MWNRASRWNTSRTAGVPSVQAANIPDDRLRMATERFYDFYKHLKELDSRVKLHYEDMERTAKSRALVMETLRTVSRDTPLQDLVMGKKKSPRQGAIHSGGDFGSKDHQNQPEDSSTSSSSSSSTSPSRSYYSSTLDAKQTASHLKRYREEIVSYVSEWEKTVSTRVAAELKHISVLFKTWDRYRSKVLSLKQALEKKKQPNKALEDKLAWNESKLRNAKREYRRNLVAVTLLTEEVTDRAWKELVPLLVRMMDFDVSRIKNSNELGESLTDIREEMVQLSRRYEMDFEAVHTGRLRILREEDAIDFVDPEDLQDLESTVLVSFEQLNGKRNISAPPLGERVNSQDQDEKPAVQESAAAENTRDVQEATAAENNPNAQGAKVPEVEDEDDEESSCAVPNFPRAIYLGREGPALVDDETTLTGMPDLASV